MRYKQLPAARQDEKGMGGDGGDDHYGPLICSFEVTAPMVDNLSTGCPSGGVVECGIIE